MAGGLSSEIVSSGVFVMADMGKPYHTSIEFEPNIK